MKILNVGSLPPIKDGIADHNYVLYKHLLYQTADEMYILPSIYTHAKANLDIPSNRIISYEDINHINFDLVHFQVGNSYASTYVFQCFKLFRNKNIKKIVTFHDFTNTNLAKILRTIRSSPFSLLYELKKPSMKEIIENTDKAIVYSNFIKNKLVQKFGNNEKLISTYIGAENFQLNKKSSFKKNLGAHKNTLILSSFGFITPRKGYEEVIKALDLLNKNIDFKYYIIGNFNFFHYKIYLQYLVNKLGLKDKIIFTGYLNIEETQKLLLASDVIVQPRKYSNEGASASLATTLFSGKPIITSDIGGFSEYITNGITGILIKHDISSYQKAIHSLYEDELLREKIGENSLKWANQNLLWDKIARKHIEIYNNLFEGK